MTPFDTAFDELWIRVCRGCRMVLRAEDLAEGVEYHRPKCRFADPDVVTQKEVYTSHAAALLDGEIWMPPNGRALTSTAGEA